MTTEHVAAAAVAVAAEPTAAVAAAAAAAAAEPTAAVAAAAVVEEIPAIPETPEDCLLVNPEPIGGGGFGIVYPSWLKFFNEKTNKEESRAVVLKFPKTTSSIETLRKEANVLFKLRGCRNIVQLIGICLDHNFPAFPNYFSIVMEYMPQNSLYNLLQNNKGKDISASIIFDIIMDICEGLSFMHRNEVLHCDLKSSNVLLRFNGSRMLAKLADFGSSISGSEIGHFCQYACASMRWMAPEVICRDPNTIASDVYSFGIVLWEILTRKDYHAPYDGYRDEDICSFANTGAGFSNLLKILLDKLPPEDVLSCLVKHCLNPNPVERPTDEGLSKELREARAVAGVDVASRYGATMTEVPVGDSATAAVGGGGGSGAAAASAVVAAARVAPKCSVAQIRKALVVTEERSRAEADAHAAELAAKRAAELAAKRAAELAEADARAADAAAEAAAEACRRAVAEAQAKRAAENAAVNQYGEQWRYSRV